MRTALALGNPVVDSFERYRGACLDAADQLDTLRRFNTLYWGGRLTEEQFNEVNLDPLVDHDQQVRRLLVLHVWFGTLTETINYWWRVYAGEYAASWYDDDLQHSRVRLRLHDRACSYKPGITPVFLDLTYGWDPTRRRTLKWARKQARAESLNLAGTEVMSALALHPQLLKAQDGRRLPYCNLPGIRVSAPHRTDGQSHALNIFWCPTQRMVHLFARPLRFTESEWSAPVLI
jgi:hypothetical protein